MTFVLFNIAALTFPKGPNEQKVSFALLIAWREKGLKLLPIQSLPFKRT